ncbi:hypothetical protein PAMP_022750 [Pampus punctatissimus]
MFSVLLSLPLVWVRLFLPLRMSKDKYGTNSSVNFAIYAAAGFECTTPNCSLKEKYPKVAGCLVIFRTGLMNQKVD